MDLGLGRQPLHAAGQLASPLTPVLESPALKSLGVAAAAAAIVKAWP